MADPKKRDGANVVPEQDTAAAKKQKPSGEDIVGEDIFAWLTDFNAESIAELMSLLDPATANTVQVRFAENPKSDEILYNSSSFVTINGNEETSGSSYSAAETLMASIDTRSVPGPGEIAGPWWTVPDLARGLNYFDSASSVGYYSDSASSVGYYSESASSVGYYSDSASSVGGGENASSCGELDDLARFLGEDMI